MATHNEPEIILYDLDSTKNICFSPVVWRIRLMLNYKQVSYRTVFLDFPDIEPTLKELGLVPPESASGSPGQYTVPAIHHMPTNTYLMDSKPISEFLESTYPNPPVPLTSELGRQIEAESRSAIGPAFRTAVLPREIHILTQRGQEYFRRTREAALGHRLEDLLEGDKEEQSWASVDKAMDRVGELIRTHQADGPFVLGARPSYTDFFITGSLQSARVVDEGVFQRIIRYPGFGEVYYACQPFMEKKT